MTKRLLLFLLPLLLFALTTTSYAAQVTNLSSSFTRGAGTPSVEQKRFAGVAGPATIEVVNGGLGDTANEKVSSSVIRINGTTVFDASNFNQNALTLTKQVVLAEGQNSIDVLLQGKPGGIIAIRVRQEVAAEGAAIVGPSGGKVVVADIQSPIYGARCVIPSMALSKDEVVTIKVAEHYVEGQQSGVGEVVDFGPSGTVFSAPVTITLPYSIAKVREKQIASENSLKIYHYKDDKNIWVNVPRSYVDAANSCISVEVSHFSKYQINGDKLYDVNKGISPDSRENILLIHGLQLTSSGYADDPKEVFGNLSTFLSDNYHVWYLSYDSQSAISSNGEDLYQIIGKIKEKTGNPKVNIIGHSEGGLVARSYMQGSTYAGDVSVLIQLGTPNHGTDYVSTICSSANDFITAITCGYVSSLPSVQEMSDPNSNFYKSINDPVTMPHNAVIYSIYNGDLPTPGEDTPGDRVVTKKSARLSEFGEFPGIKNIELNDKLYHATLLGADGIASIASTKSHPACDSRYTCDHPVWKLISSILPAQSGDYIISGRVVLNGMGLPGVTVYLSGSDSSPTVTDSSGAYVFAGVASRSYTLTAALARYSFSPSNLILPVISESLTVPDINATLNSSPDGGPQIAQKIAAGNLHSLAIMNDGTVWAWGSNTRGELGIGTASDFNTSPVRVSGISGGVVAIAAGNLHSLAMKNDGTVWAWGWNYSGQLGNGTTIGSYIPVQVSGLSGVIAIAAGSGHSLAIKNDGTVWAWGYNHYGQLGNGTTTDSSIPFPVTGLSGVKAIAAGINYSLAIKSDGTVWAWGWNNSGQLGNGKTIDSSTPVAVSGLSGVIAIAAGTGHSLAVKNDGTVWGWGYNAFGQVGNGTTIDSSTPVWVDGISEVVAIAAGHYHSLATKSDGSVWGWGYNIVGQLGNGATTDSSTPVQVNGISGSVANAAGYYHSLAIKNDGTVWAWGGDGWGQLGNGMLTDSSSPSQVSWF